MSEKVINNTPFMAWSNLKVGLKFARNNGKMFSSAVYYTKKGKLKLMKNLQNKFVAFRMHKDYKLIDMSNNIIEPHSPVFDISSSTVIHPEYYWYKVSFYDFISALAADTVRKNVIHTRDMSGEKHDLYSSIQQIASVHKKDYTKLCDLRLDL